MKKNSKKIIFIGILALLTFIGVLFLYNHLTVSSAIQTQKGIFEEAIKNVSSDANKEDNTSKIKSIGEFKKIEKEIDQFSKRVNFTELSKDDFKSESELIHKKLSEVIEKMNFSYKVRLDENVKEIEKLKKAEIEFLIKNLDNLIEEIKKDNILNVDVIKTFEDKAIEMKNAYTARIKELDANSSKDINSKNTVPVNTGSIQVDTNTDIQSSVPTVKTDVDVTTEKDIDSEFKLDNTQAKLIPYHEQIKINDMSISIETSAE
ncbi:MAG: hypothetical protein ACRCV7_03725 [Culicoidibacterales bacterium]